MQSKSCTEAAHISALSHGRIFKIFFFCYAGHFDLLESVGTSSLAICSKLRSLSPKITGLHVFWNPSKEVKI